MPGITLPSSLEFFHQKVKINHLLVSYAVGSNLLSGFPLAFSGPKPAFISWVEGEVEPGGSGSRDGSEKEGLQKSPKWKEMEHGSLSQGVAAIPAYHHHKAACPELYWNSRWSSTKTWLKDIPTRRPLYSCPDYGCDFSYSFLLVSHRAAQSGGQPLPYDQAPSYLLY